MTDCVCVCVCVCVCAMPNNLAVLLVGVLTADRASRRAGWRKEAERRQRQAEEKAKHRQQLMGEEALSPIEGVADWGAPKRPDRGEC